MEAIQKIPVTIITGFLGAGKTTFINNLLQKESTTQFALVENEFGEVAIDSKLIKGVDSSQLFELKQGCICCTITDEYELVLQELAERFPETDHLIIETTGVADPAPVVQPFFADEVLKEIYEFNGTICLVDAINFDSQPEKEISIKQLAIADLVLINKAEKLSVSEKQYFNLEIAKISPFANIQFIEYGNAGNIEIEKIQGQEQNNFSLLRLPVNHSHIQTKTLCFSNPLNKPEFLRWLEYTLDIYKKQIYRCKGIVCFQNEPFEYIIQGVGGSFEITEENLIMGDVKSELVFIGDLEGVNLSYGE